LTSSMTGLDAPRRAVANALFAVDCAIVRRATSCPYLRGQGSIAKPEYYCSDGRLVVFRVINGLSILRRCAEMEVFDFNVDGPLLDKIFQAEWPGSDAQDSLTDGNALEIGVIASRMADRALS
jgi:hypothetical protein